MALLDIWRRNYKTTLLYYEKKEHLLSAVLILDKILNLRSPVEEKNFFKYKYAIPVFNTLLRMLQELPQHSTIFNTMLCAQSWSSCCSAIISYLSFLFISQNPDSQLFLSMAYLNFHSKSWSSSCVVSLFLTWLHFSSQSTLFILSYHTSSDV